MNKILALLTIILLAGCATQIMGSYIGKDIRTVYADYGPPQYSFDMPEGKKAYQWLMTSTQTTPEYTHTTGNISSDSYILGNNISTKSDISATSTTVGGQSQMKKCFTPFIQFGMIM